MGSLKDEMRGLRDDHQPCEKAEDGVCTGVSDGSVKPEGQQLLMGQETQTQEGRPPRENANTEEDKNGTSKDQALSGGNCGDKSDSGPRRDVVPKGDQITAPLNDATIKFDGGKDADVQEKTHQDKEKNEKVLVPVPSTPDPCDPRSPAPLGQQHMRTQVSLEVVQCCSAATSPMTPPEGGNSFFFPTSFGKFGAAGGEAKDAEMQVSRQVEFCSVATSPFPMTPKTPSTTAFPELSGQETAPREERIEEQQENAKMDKESTEESELTGALELNEGSNAAPDSGDSGSTENHGMPENSKQQRMGSMDQDITILVTHYVNNEEEEEDKEETSFHSTETNVGKIEECDEEGPEDEISKRPPNKVEKSSTNQPEVKDSKDACEETKPHIPESPAPFGCHNMRTQVSLEVVQCQSVATSPMTPPDGDQAFCFPSSLTKLCTSETRDTEMQVGQQVEYRSVATAPMTPRTPTVTTFPEVRKEMSVEEKIVEEEEKEEEATEEEKDGEEATEEEKDGEEAKEEKDGEATEEEKDGEATEDEEKEEKGKKGGEEERKEEVEEDEDEKDEEKSDEPVQEVSWDEKGMTWEVYGAVVEVAVLGSAIQKHLEKQVKKQKLQASLPPPPPLNPSAMPLSADTAPRGSGSGKSRAGKRGEQDGKVGRRRRNPFRQLMENMQQPHCCSRAHTTE